jgi:predicted nucleic acid-binding protein
MVDATILVYALTPQSRFHQPCRDLLQRGAQGAIQLCATITIVADVIHRAMVLEVLSQGQGSSIEDQVFFKVAG